MKTIILDTNFLMLLGQLKLDILSEIERIADFTYEIAIVEKIKDELNIIIEHQKGKHKRAAKLALSFIDRMHLKIIKTTEEGSVDDILVALAAKDKNTIIATNDVALKKRLQEENSHIIILRQKTHLQLLL